MYLKWLDIRIRYHYLVETQIVKYYCGRCERIFQWICGILLIIINDKFAVIANVGTNNQVGSVQIVLIGDWSGGGQDSRHRHHTLQQYAAAQPSPVQAAAKLQWFSVKIIFTQLTLAALCRLCAGEGRNPIRAANDPSNQRGFTITEKAPSRIF